MNYYKNYLLTIIFCIISIYDSYAVTYFVKPSVANNTGTSWANATNFKDAISKAVSGDEIWVLAGTYLPSTTNDPYDSFYLNNSRNGVKIYGGFAGTETLLSQRNYQNNVTIISGDIGTINDNSDNTYTLFNITSGVGRSTIIDGFTLQLANNQIGFGGGIANYGSPTIQNCKFINNKALWGACMFNYNTAFPYLLNCEFKNNYSVNDAAAIYNNLNYNPAFDPYTNNLVGFVIENCEFENNQSHGVSNGADLYGGTCLFNDNATGFIKNSQFDSNTSYGSVSYGGAMINMAHGLYGGSNNYKKFDVAVQGCSFSGNSAQTSGGAIQNSQVTGGISGRFTILDSYFENNSPDNINNVGNVTINIPSMPSDNLSLSGNSTVCYNNSTWIVVNNSQSGVNYQLRDNADNSIIAGASVDGTGSPINLSSGVLTNQKTFNVLAKDKTTGVSLKLKNTFTVQVKPISTPTLTIAPDQSSVCTGQPLTYTVNASNYTGTLGYEWKLNGAVLTNTQNFLTSNSFNNGDQLVVKVFNADASLCQSTVCLTQNVNIITTPITPQLSLSQQSTACDGQNITLKASPSNHSGVAVYEWKVNGVVQAGSSDTFQSANFKDGDQVTVKLLNTGIPCQNEAVATQSVSVSSKVTPQLSLSQQSTACDGQNITLKASPSNHSGVAVYEWKVNGVVQAGSSDTFQSANFKDGDQVTVKLLNTGIPCQNPIETSLVVNLSAKVTPQLLLTSQQAAFCEGQYITLTAQASNYSGSPVFEWRLNGDLLNGNQSVYVSNGLKEGDVVSVKLLNNGNACQNEVESTKIIHLYPSLSPSLVLSSDKKDDLKEGDLITFTAIGTNLREAQDPSQVKYIWKINNNVVVTNNSTTFSTNNLKNGDIVSVSAMVNTTCISNRTINSNEIKLNINTNLNTEEILDINVYPNPSSGVYYIDAKGQSMDDMALTIYDQKGGLVFHSEKSVFGTSYQIDLSKLDIGTYYMYIRTGKTNSVKRIVKY